MKIHQKNYQTVWLESDAVKMIDQTLLPHTFSIVSFKRYEQVADAIRKMVVRGAPAIGAAGAYGLALAAVSYKGATLAGLRRRICQAKEVLAGTRPTAYDLFDGLECVSACLEEGTVSSIKKTAPIAKKTYF